MRRVARSVSDQANRRAALMVLGACALLGACATPALPPPPAAWHQEALAARAVHPPARRKRVTAARYHAPAREPGTPAATASAGARGRGAPATEASAAAATPPAPATSVTPAPAQMATAAAPEPVAAHPAGPAGSTVPAGAAGMITKVRPRTDNTVGCSRAATLRSKADVIGQAPHDVAWQHSLRQIGCITSPAVLEWELVRSEGDVSLLRVPGSTALQMYFRTADLSAPEVGALPYGRR